MRFLTKALRISAVTALMAVAASSAEAADISGAGASFPYPIYAKWADAYKKETGIGLNYQSIGSGGGIKAIQSKTVTFGASDAPLKVEELNTSGLIQFPMIMGGVVPVVNVGANIGPNELTLDGPTLADIYMGKIAAWNDPRIAKLNPNAKLPSTAIAPVYRSDGSGTNFLFTTYLSEVSPEFKQKIGAAASVQWPVGIGAKGNEGVSGMAKQTQGAIGYVEYAYAKQNKMASVKLVNKDGKAVEPSSATFQAAAAGADWSKAPGYYLVLTSQPGAQSWPITGASFILLHKQPQDPAATLAALKFFDWAFKKGGKMAEDLDYVPMPDSVVKQVEQTWTKEVVAAGKPVWQ
jgi:phosphate transport system substrate-binding protein